MDDFPDDGVVFLNRIRRVRDRSRAVISHLEATIDASARHLRLAEMEALLHEAEIMALALRRVSVELTHGWRDFPAHEDKEKANV